MSLGASLYLPATRPDLPELLNGIRLPGLRSLIVCTEDAVAEENLSLAFENVRQVARSLRPSSTLRFLRVRRPQLLEALARMDGFDGFDGLVLPKVTLENVTTYARALDNIPMLPIMPVLETEIVFDLPRLASLITAVEDWPNPVIAFRIGGNDILSRLGLRRPRRQTAYDTPLREAIVNVMAVLRPRGIAVAAPVFEHYSDLETLRREVELDIAHGLTTKSVIHPSQVPVVEAAYKPRLADVLDARQIVATDAPAVFGSIGSMCEVATHQRWAAELLERAAVHGISSIPEPKADRS
jgi:citrate lyase beta subunit